MIFPFTIRYKRRLSSKTNITDNSEILDCIKKIVEKNKGKAVEVSSNKLCFKVGFWVFSWDFFAQIEKGIFTVEGGEFTFEFFMFRLLLLGHSYRF
jgi:hypothetical protein